MNINDAKSRIINSKFSWSGIAPSPFGTIGNVSFHLQNEEFGLPKTVDVLLSTAHLISRYIGTINAISSVINFGPYLLLVSEVLERAGFADSEFLPSVAWPIIQDGLNRYAISLNEILLVAQPESDHILLPISNMHLWALAETARAFNASVKEGRFAEDTYLDVKEILRLTEVESAVISREALPYINIK